ncbi:LuxR C-terminal-related transcriptional regulator [Pseudomonas sp. DTU_2021_1001937_2_SI_NGA_ILE_001]|uniref:LuxR C-terminal-related transcriptional regulator n=1 Tax=Pseudomonas sp. DTU_2021_1001937_2_SI_NGA_ILE_001 TaxID=3077589 RepID=UPI0025D751FB|nr:LuxR C-terminal-related transcriptional regulator [Pseudomonas sp. DTU_2021_1001937_2_SI_NGA_ILE_001]WNW10570.1 LuxR C-terminal-related transcriptional regulator [Pseudomonas sp. DTU_2021_1001937_2_SI_NGA_ILE_001]
MRAAALGPAPDAASTALTEREEQTLQLIAAGNSNKQIARTLGISDGTVKTYVRSLLRKFHLHSRLELATWVHRHTDKTTATLKADLDPAAVAGLINDLPVLVYRGDNARAWYMDYVSEGCLQLTGYPAEYLTRDPEHSFGSLILAEYADYVWYCVQCALLKREPFQLRYRICCADGRIKEVCETGVGVYSANGEVLGVEGAIFEVAG